MIVFNPKKPTGKYHFRMYVVCCSSTWIALNYKIYCNRCDVSHRLDRIVGEVVVQERRSEFDKVSKIRQHVLEVIRPFFGGKRIVNTAARCNFYKKCSRMVYTDVGLLNPIANTFRD